MEIHQLLPLELMSLILTWLPCEDVERCRLVCSAWYDICDTYPNFARLRTVLLRDKTEEATYQHGRFNWAVEQLTGYIRKVGDSGFNCTLSILKDRARIISAFSWSRARTEEDKKTQKDQKGRDKDSNEIVLGQEYSLKGSSKWSGLPEGFCYWPRGRVVIYRQRELLTMRDLDKKGRRILSRDTGIPSGGTSTGRFTKDKLHNFASCTVGDTFYLLLRYSGYAAEARSRLYQWVSKESKPELLWQSKKAKRAHIATDNERFLVLSNKLAHSKLTVIRTALCIIVDKVKVPLRRANNAATLCIFHQQICVVTKTGEFLLYPFYGEPKWTQKRVHLPGAIKEAVVWHGLLAVSVEWEEKESQQTRKTAICFLDKNLQVLPSLQIKSPPDEQISKLYTWHDGRLAVMVALANHRDGFRTFLFKQAEEGLFQTENEKE